MVKTTCALLSGHHAYSSPAFTRCGISGKSPKAFESQCLHLCMCEDATGTWGEPHEGYRYKNTMLDVLHLVKMKISSDKPP